MASRLSIKHTALAITACLLWSTAFVGVKYGLQFAPPFFFAGTRFMISGLLLLPFCGGIAQYLRTIRTRFPTIFLISIFQTFLLYACFYLGMTLVPGALAAIVIGASPLFIAITAHIAMPADKMTLSKLMSLLLGIAGVIIISISRQPWIVQGLRQFLGVLILIGGGISSAIGNVVVARDRYNINPIVLNSFQIFFGGFLLLLTSFIIEGIPKLSFPPSFYGALLYLAALSAAAFSIWFSLLKTPRIKVSELNLWKFIIPVCGAMLSWLFLPEESPELFAVIGMVCVALSILSYNLFQLLKKGSARATKKGKITSE